MSRVLEEKDLVRMEAVPHSPAGSWRVTLLSHPCPRHAWYARYRADDGDPIPIRGRIRMDVGESIEGFALGLLAKQGWDVILAQAWVYGEGLGLPDTRGRVDAVLVPPAELADALGIPQEARTVEVKSVQSWAFDRLRDLRDLIDSPNWWVRGYPIQLGLYLRMWQATYPLPQAVEVSPDAGWLLLVDGATGRMRMIEVLASEVADLVAEAIERGKLLHQTGPDSDPPDLIEYGAACEMCDWRTACRGRQQDAEPLLTLDSDPKLKAHVERLLRVRADSEPGKKTWEKADKELKQILSANGVRNAYVGGWAVKAKTIEVKRRAQPEKIVQQTRWTVKYVGGETES